jgi:hypothetical protein
MIGPVTRGALGFAIALGTSALLAAPAQALVFNAVLGPEAAGATGSGTASLTIDELTNLMAIQVDFQGLSGNTSVSHIHGPTPRSLSHITPPPTSPQTASNLPRFQ